MSENAERPARSGRGTGEKERPTASSVLFPAAERARRSGRPHPSCCSRPRMELEGAADLPQRIAPGSNKQKSQFPLTAARIAPMMLRL